MWFLNLDFGRLYLYAQALVMTVHGKHVQEEKDELQTVHEFPVFVIFMVFVMKQ